VLLWCCSPPQKKYGNQVEERATAAVAAKKPAPSSPVAQVRDALDWATPVMLGTVYFLTLYEVLRPKRR